MRDAFGCQGRRPCRSCQHHLACRPHIRDGAPVAFEPVVRWLGIPVSIVLAWLLVRPRPRA
jgi:hypothetical protein